MGDEAVSPYTPGRVIDGRWELVRDLGGRLAGTRWDARHVRTHRRAILRVAPSALDEGTAAAWLHRETVVLARVTHPAAVDIRDAGQTELGDPYLVLEPVEGRTLQGLAAARGRLPWSFVGTVVQQLAEVLACAHEAGVVHREIAPDRVVFVRDPYGIDRVKLIGWEAAFVEDIALDEVVDGVSVATDYTAPEQVEDPTAVDGRADVFALGMMAFEALTGQLPAAGVSTPDDVPEELIGVLLRAVAQNRDARFAHARDLSAALERAVTAATARTTAPELPTREAPKVQVEAKRPASPAPPAAKPAIAAGPEQRKAPRAAYQTPVRLQIAGAPAIEGRSEDVSAGGILIVGRAELAQGTEVTLRLALPIDGKVVLQKCVVRWVRPARASGQTDLRILGLQFVDADAGLVRQLERYVSLMGDGRDGSLRPPG